MAFPWVSPGAVIKTGEEYRMEEIEITWAHTLKIWWAFVWRLTVFGALAGGVAGFILGIILAASGMMKHIEVYGQLLGMLVSIPIGIWAMNIILTKQFRDFRVALVPSAEALLEKSINEQNTQPQ
jgi:hypothetical protein